MLKKLFFLFFVKPLILFICGVHIKNRQNLPRKRPSIIISNHNSHLDTLTLMSLYSLNELEFITPVGAKDYFYKNSFIKFISQKLIQITPIDRKIKFHTDPLIEVKKALKQNKIVIVYPEGSRGEPEEMKKFKTGISHLAKQFPQIPIHPIFMHGTGKNLPKGEALFVPFIIDINIGEAFFYDESKSIREFTTSIEKRIISLRDDFYR